MAAAPTMTMELPIELAALLKEAMGELVGWGPERLM